MKKKILITCMLICFSLVSYGDLNDLSLEFWLTPDLTIRTISQTELAFDKTVIPSSNSTLKVTVDSSNSLMKQVSLANRRGGHTTIELSKGFYPITKTIYIKKDKISLVSKSRNPEDVVISGGTSITATRVKNLIKVAADNFTLDGITLEYAGWHLLQIAGENDADYPEIRNCIMRDAYQQLLKVSYDKRKRPNISSDQGIVENCSFLYTAGRGPNYYIGGIDAHAIKHWTIKNNKFKGIASPGDKIAEHAIHIWNNSQHNVVTHNYIENCDRGIGFGMKLKNMHPNIKHSNYGGIISNNVIVHYDNGAPFADTGIILEESPYTVVKNNRIFMEHDYPRAIEYRFAKTQKVVIKNNITNKKISSRNGGSATVSGNITDANLRQVLDGG